MENKKILILIFGMLLLSGVLVSANGDYEGGIEEGKKLAESEISCDQLTNEQLEEIGDYYMEQMHPGEAHEMMDQMMGGEGSESLKQAHINIARRIYCNENVGGMMGGNMMAGRGMMGNYYQMPQNNLYQNNFIGFQIFSYVLITLVIIVLVLIVTLLINKSKDTLNQKRRLTK